MQVVLAVGSEADVSFSLRGELQNIWNWWCGSCWWNLTQSPIQRKFSTFHAACKHGGLTSSSAREGFSSDTVPHDRWLKTRAKFSCCRITAQLIPPSPIQAFKNIYLNKTVRGLYLKLLTSYCIAFKAGVILYFLAANAQQHPEKKPTLYILSSPHITHNYLLHSLCCCLMGEGKGYIPLEGKVYDEITKAHAAQKACLTRLREKTPFRTLWTQKDKLKHEGDRVLEKKYLSDLILSVKCLRQLIHIQVKRNVSLRLFLGNLIRFFFIKAK